MDTYMIIEHPRRGCLKEVEYDPYGTDTNPGARWVPRFSREGSRTDENIRRYHSIQEVVKDLLRIPQKVRRECVVREAPGPIGSDKFRAMSAFDKMHAFEWKRVDFNPEEVTHGTRIPQDPR